MWLKKYKDSNRELVLQRNREYCLLNPEKRKATAKAYREANPEKDAASVRLRQASKLQRTPSWLSLDDKWMMQEAYRLAKVRSKMFGFSWHVDHIVPLQGKTASGLHVPWNLQVIPGVLNMRKSNKL